jgi:type I restriction enzyme M protein
VANPPFGIKWEPPKMDMFDSDPRFEGVPAMPSRGMADFAFMLHILYLLSETGVAVVLDSHSVLFRDGNEGKIRQWMLERNCIEKIVYVPENQFVDTKIKTCIWVLNKHKASTDIVFVDKKNAKEITVPFDEIKKHGFSLAQNIYFPPPKAPELPAVPVLLSQMHDDINGQLKAVIELTKKLGNDEAYETFIDGLQMILDDAKTYYGCIGEGLMV